MKPRLLDLFCGAGGAGVGYSRAGFEVVGVDITEQPHYPFEFHRADALAFPLTGFDVIHASPPCQAYSISRNNGCHANAPDLVPAVLKRLRGSGLSWIVENVPGSPLPSAVQLCGASFGLGVASLDLSRHRWFATSFGLLAPPCQHRRGSTVGVYGNGTNSWHRRKLGRCLAVSELRAAMRIDWMSRRELSQSIPPAYTEWIGRRLLEQGINP